MKGLLTDTSSLLDSLQTEQAEVSLASIVPWPGLKSVCCARAQTRQPIGRLHVAKP